MHADDRTALDRTTYHYGCIIIWRNHLAQYVYPTTMHWNGCFVQHCQQNWNDEARGKHPIFYSFYRKCIVMLYQYNKGVTAYCDDKRIKSDVAKSENV